MINNYVSKRALEDSNIKLYEKVELNFIRAKKLQPAIDEVKEEICAVQKTIDTLYDKIKATDISVTLANRLTETKAD
jgi:hypothetical protein